MNGLRANEILNKLNDSEIKLYKKQFKKIKIIATCIFISIALLCLFFNPLKKSPTFFSLIVVIAILFADMIIFLYIILHMEQMSIIDIIMLFGEKGYKKIKQKSSIALEKVNNSIPCNIVNQLSIEEREEIINQFTYFRNVNQLITKMNKNEYLKSIIYKFVNSEIDNVFALELLLLPFKYFSKTQYSTYSFIYDKTKLNEFIEITKTSDDLSFVSSLINYYKNGQSNYFHFLKSITADDLKFYYLDNSSFYNHGSYSFSICYSMVSNSLVNIKICDTKFVFNYHIINSKINAIINAFSTHKDLQDIFSETYKSTEIFDAFTFLCYTTKRDIIRDNLNKILTSNNLTFNNNLDEVTTALYKSEMSDKNIIYYAMCFYGLKNKKTKFILKKGNIDYINNTIKKIKNILYLEYLENGKKHKKYSLTEIDLMTGQEFEKVIADLFIFFGYDITLTPTTGDQGIDVLAQKGNTLIAIQAKRYNNSVGNHAVMETVAGAKYYKANKCMVITNNYFTPSAISLAKENNVELWDRKILSEKLALLVEEN